MQYNSAGSKYVLRGLEEWDRGSNGDPYMPVFLYVDVYNK